MSVVEDINVPTKAALQFSYKPLNSDAKEIRLLVLLPGAMGKPLQSRMRHASLKDDANPETDAYEALSYVWGSTDVTYRIHINGIPFRIHQNLYRALLQLRLLHTERVLWIDAICINQKDIKERNHQVRQMVDIYSRASSVLVWLGLATPQTKRAIIFIRESKNIRFTSFAPYESQYPAVRDLCMRPYWQRVWIIQEIGLARNLMIVCGTEQVSWDYFSQFMFNISNSKAANVPKVVQIIRSSHAARILDQRISYQNHKCSLWRLLRNFADSLCTLPHDKVYGVLGLASDCGQDDLLVDYSKPLTELHKDVLSFYYRSIQRQATNEIGMNAEPPSIVSFSSFLSRLLDVGVLDISPFEAKTKAPSVLGLIPPDPAQILLQVEATFLGMITVVGDVQTDYPGAGHHFEMYEEPTRDDEAYLGKFLGDSRVGAVLMDQPIRLNKSAHNGIPLQEEEKLYLEASKKQPGTPTPNSASNLMPRDTQGHARTQSRKGKWGTRWLKATNDLRGIGTERTQVGDLLYTLSKQSRKLVIRPGENEYTIVGTALLEFDWSASDRRFLKSSPRALSPVIPLLPPFKMNLYLEVETLQELTLL